MLTDKAIKQAIRDVRNADTRKPVRLYDGGGLYLEISRKRGLARWALKYRYGAKERRAAIGAYPALSIASARVAARDVRIRIDGGLPPHAAQEHAERDTFDKLAAEWYRTNKPRMSARHAACVERYLRYCSNGFGHKSLAEIKPADVLECLRKLENKGLGETVKRVRLYAAQIFDYAAATGCMQPFNPAGPLKGRGILAAKPPVRHHPAMPFDSMAPWLRTLEKAPYAFEVRAALRFAVLTALRTNEVIGLRWSDVAPDFKSITIPGDRMKGKRPHKVLLSKPARNLVEIMDFTNGRSDPEARVFPGRYGGELSNAAMAMALRRTCPKGVVATVHGFRSTFSTWAHATGAAPLVVERCLAHVNGDKVAAAYNRATFDADAAKLWDRWADALAAD